MICKNECTEEDGQSTSFVILQNVLQDVIDKDTTIDKNLAYTTGVVCDHLIGSLHDVIRFHCRLIENATKEILLTTSYWEGSSMSAFMIFCSLKSVLSRRPHVKVRIVVDNGKAKNLRYNVRWIRKMDYKKELGLVLDPTWNVLAKSVHIPLLGTMHAKFLVVDSETVIISSNNVQDRPNVELAVSLKGNVCQSFVDIFRRIWNLGNFDDHGDGDGDGEHRSSMVPGGSEMILVNRRAYGRLDRDVNTPQNCAWWTIMSLAKNYITICTPTFNAKHAIQAVYNACKRNITTTLILTKNFNDKKEAMPFQGGTNNNVVKALRKRLRKVGKETMLVVRWYVGKNERRPRIGVHSHVKFLIVDDEIVIFGNGNMDTQSWYHSMEVNIALESSELCKKMIDVMMSQSTSDREST